jgi:hypothetical protein
MPYKMKKLSDRHDQLKAFSGSHQPARMTSAKQLLFQ